MGIRSLFRAGALALLVSSLTGAAEGLRVSAPWIAGFHPLDESHQELSPLNAPKAALLQLTTKMFSDTAQIDFEKRQITFRTMDPLGYTMWEFHYGELSDYLASRRYFAVNQSWRKGNAAMQPSGVAADKQGMKMAWELPVQYPSWAQRVLGKEPPKLTISGFLEITMGYQNTNYDENASTQTLRPTNEPIFDVNYEFTITGSVGRLINLNIRASKDNNFDISENLKNFKIEYKESTPGELEDEIIQELIVGYTGFNMPGTSLSGYSESHEGLFGVRIKSKLGPLELTTILSTENGQANKKTYSSNSSSNAATFPAKDFQKDRYFFLDNAYRRYYIKKYAPQGGSPVAPPKVKELSVWRLYNNIMATENKSHIRRVRVDTTDQRELYERLVRDKHYYLDPVEGYIRFSDTVNFTDQQQVAIYMRTEDTTLVSMQKGRFDIEQTADSAKGIKVGDTLWTLWTIRPKEPIQKAEDDTSRFYLMWRNVYGPANFSDPTSFRLSVKQIDPSKEERLEKNPADNMFFADILGLADNNVPKIQDNLIYNTQFGDLVIPPHDTSFYGLEPFNNKALGAVRDSLIYRYADDHPSRRADAGYKSMYEIVISGSKKQTTFDDLGWGIMKELVKADGVKMERDQDYTINYDMGSVDLISARAKAAQTVEIEYQSEALFVPDKKMFFGTNGRVDLPFISEKSYAGASLLFQNTENNENVPRLDQEPFKKLLLDVNTHLEFEPEWMTSVVKALPLVKTQAASNVTFDVEFARSVVTPNKRGSAYIDDFEDSKQSDGLSNGYKGWFLASPPKPIADSLYFYPPAWDVYWFSPREADEKHRIRRDSIIILSEAERKAMLTGSSFESVLRLHATPAPESDALLPRYRKAWAGLMTSVSQSFANKQLSQFFEFFVKADGGFNGKGTLRIQMGKMREDVSLDGGPPNNFADNEDTSTIMLKETYDRNLDLGWDRLRDSAEVRLVPGAAEFTWDTIRIGDPLLKVGDPQIKADSLDPARDNYQQYYSEAGDVKNYRYACRRQDDRDLNSEDINYDGSVQTALAEQYFEFAIDLNDAQSPLIDTTIKYKDPTRSTWRKYRIPLHEVVKGYERMLDTVGDPSWSNITTVRLIWTDFDSSKLNEEKHLVFYNMEFAGNQWMEIVDSTRVKIRSSVISTREDANYEKSLNNYQHKNIVNRDRDEYGEPEAEQSLRLNFVNLVPEDTALVKKNVQYQNLNFSAYDRLTMQVFGVTPPDAGVPPAGSLLYGGDVRFVFRFGSDDSTYYEYSRPIYSEWNNPVSIDLKELSRLKDAFMVDNRDSAINTYDEKGNGITWVVRAPRGRQPNFAHIQWMALGVYRTQRSGGNDSLSGEVWVNEMKLEGIGKIKGTASRIDLSTKWADLLTLQGRMEYESGNFRRMTETQNVPEATDMLGSASASIGLEKFLPEEWGLQLTTGVNYNSTLKRPQLKNETDVYLVDASGDPDGFFDMVKDAASIMTGIPTAGNRETTAEPYQTSSVGRTYFTGYKKTKHHENPIVNLFADRWSADARYSTNISEVRYGVDSTGTGDDHVFAKRDTSDIYSGKLHYDLTPYDPPEWTTWKPFAEVKHDWFPSRLKSYEFTLLPRSFSIDMADITLSKQKQDDSWRNIHSYQTGYTVRHNTSISHTPLSPLCDLDYSLGINRDLNSVLIENTAGLKEDTAGLRGTWNSIVNKGKPVFRRNNYLGRYGVLWGEKDRTQHTGMRLSPHFFEWLTTSADYSNDYTGRITSRPQDPEPYLDQSVKSSVTLDGTLNFDQLFTELKTAGGKSAVGGLFDMMKKGFDQIGLRQISCNYKAESDLNNDYVSAGLLDSLGIRGMKDIMLYQVGLKGRSPLDLLTGEMDDHSFLGMRSRSDNPDHFRGDSRKVDRTLRFSSALSFKPLDLTVNQLSLNHGINYTIYPDSTRNDTVEVFPEFSIGGSTQILDRLPLFKKNFQSVNLNSSYTYRRSDQLTAREGGSNRSVKFDFTPLVSFTGTLKKWPIRLDYRFNLSREKSMVLDEAREVADTNKNAKMRSNELTINYEIERSSKLTEIKLLMWSIPIKGRTTIGFKFNQSREEETVADRNDNTYSFVPNLSYIFTDNVTGRLDFTRSVQNREGKKTTTTSFSLVVRISF